MIFLYQHYKEVSKKLRKEWVKRFMTINYNVKAVFFND